MKLKRSFKRIVTVLSVLFVCFAILPVRAAGSSFKLEKNSFFLHPGESVTGKYTYTGSGTVEFSEPNTIENMGDVYNICTVTAGKGSFTIKAAAGNSHGRAKIDVTVDGEVKDTIEVFVYDTDNFYLIQPLADQAVLITYTMARIYVGTPYDVSLFMPVTVTSSDPSVAAPEKPVMPLGYLDMDLKKPGTTTITLKSEKLNGTLKLTVLPEGDYADYVTVKDDKSSVTVRVGTKTPDPFIMKSSEGTCKDDKLTVSVTENIPLVGEKDVVRLEKDGSITALNPGYAMVEARTRLGYRGQFEVMVYSDPEKLVFEEKTYYVDQNNDWLPYYPYPGIQPSTCGMAPFEYTSSDDKIVKAEGASLQYVKPGEVTIRAAYKDNPKIYTEFKVKAFTAADP
ncbi:MAG: hypothetical protein K6A40_02655, partial [Solobacterium sp.]|nr:hypothetical protein [Solobacterium sp.]